ncbi:uncharacterized protein LOC134844841 [Symsagittifera roscoffensis]|uniref:uncharacterized protein LOC134844841 n=1 Tax=Symsagittifera roscoffensis TaxID=84072 RepID=UPI00307C720C
MVKGFKTAVKFDEASRLEFVQGMRKRKNQRRQKAANQIKLKMKQDRRAYDRKKKQLQLKEIAELDKIEAEAEHINLKRLATCSAENEQTHFSSIPGVTIEPISFDTSHLHVTANLDAEEESESETKMKEGEYDSTKDKLDDLRHSYKKLVKDRIKKQKNKLKKRKK